ncbi:hypothetical protein [Methylomonas sp. ZR1]|uniref:hypothetical protein n=1 Tax=Methylomonas sp. ZR1 TaxID=1797072 RepID=UPI0014917D9B|nr:hypothetical protein [Methylomonas sp. ZR1]NOV29188.1 hypothetical protein [Methylomonas sp. ZR1]
MNPALNALDRIDRIACCIEAVGDLLIPEKDLHVVNREKQAMLLAYLAEELIAARNQLNQTWPR